MEVRLGSTASDPWQHEAERLHVNRQGLAQSEASPLPKGGWLLGHQRRNIIAVNTILRVYIERQSSFISRGLWSPRRITSDTIDPHRHADSPRSRLGCMTQWGSGCDQYPLSPGNMKPRGLTSIDKKDTTVYKSTPSCGLFLEAGSAV